MNAHVLSPGQLVFVDLPSGTVRLRVDWGWRFHELEHDTADLQATIILPDHGDLHVTLAPGIEYAGEEGCEGILRSLDTEDLFLEFSFVGSDEGENGPLPFSSPLLPGRYSVELLQGGEVLKEHLVVIEANTKASRILGL